MTDDPGQPPLSQDQKKLVAELMAGSLEISPEKRRAWLGERLKNQPAVLEHVLELLESIELAQEEDYLSRPTGVRLSDLGDLDGDDQPTGTDREPSRVGRYRLLRVIGEGGMGTVWQAEQTEPVRRAVAIKIIKLGMDTEEVIARFEAERQALALMSHPNIAKVLDAGTTETGRPYFVMELVDGVPITTYCNEASPDLRGRLKLFMDVCHAIQHAHQKGVIHRDIKPSNVLIATHDGTPVPKVIDFGIAKAIDRELTEKTFLTELGQCVGTPEYMAPEQGGITERDVDTRADVYSLGALLYELLTGTKPFDLRTLAEAGWDQMLKVIREVDPPKPSTRVTRLEGEAVGEAERPRARASSSARSLRGDLDWITMRAMEKDRNHRYDSAAALAQDVLRHLEDEPIAAGPPSARYRLVKFVRRNRIGVVAGAIIGTSLLVGLGIATVGLVRARRAERVAGLERDLATEAKGRAEIAAAKSEAVTEFFRELLESVDPSKAKGDVVTVRDVLDEASTRIDEGRFDEQPDVEAEIRLTIGKTYEAIGEYDPAEKQIRIAMDINLRLHGEGEEYAECLGQLVSLMWNKSDLEEAERLGRTALALKEKLYGKDQPETTSSLNDLALTLADRGEYEEAEAMLRRTLAIHRRVAPSDSADVARALNNIASVLGDRRDYEGAVALLREALVIRRRLMGDESLEVASSLNNLGYNLLALEEYDEAEATMLEALTLKKKILGESHFETGLAQMNLAAVLRNQRKFSEAEPMAAEATSTMIRALDGGSWHIGNARFIHGTCLKHLPGREEEAEKEFLEAYSVLSESLGPGHSRTLNAAGELVKLYRRARNMEEANRWRALMRKRN